ncbi:MAG: hypothetical protein M1536_00045 [Firmicutes bacterium]|nr:hypothetical protein [Bacillota bacterium]
MKWIITLIGIIFALMGLYLTFYPADVVSLIRDMQLYNPSIYRPLGAIPIIISLFILGGVRSGSMRWLVSVVGILALAKGLFLLLAPEAMVTPVIEWSIEQEGFSLYLAGGVITVMMGILLIYSRTNPPRRQE